MLEVWHLFNKFLKESITKAETEEEVYKAEIYELGRGLRIWVRDVRAYV